MGVDKYVWLLYKRQSKYGLLLLEISSKYRDLSKNALCINSANRTKSGGLVGRYTRLKAVQQKPIHNDISTNHPCGDVLEGLWSEQWLLAMLCLAMLAYSMSAAQVECPEPYRPHHSAKECDQAAPCSSGA